MKTNVFLAIGIRIIILFLVAIFSTYIPIYLNNTIPSFLGDINGECGVRHCWFNIMMILLFLLSLVNVIVGTIKTIRKNYDVSKW